MTFLNQTNVILCFLLLHLFNLINQKVVTLSLCLSLFDMSDILSDYLDIVDEGQVSIEGVGLQEGGLFITNGC